MPFFFFLSLFLYKLHVINFCRCVFARSWAYLQRYLTQIDEEAR